MKWSIIMFKFMIIIFIASLFIIYLTSYWTIRQPLYKEWKEFSLHWDKPGITYTQRDYHFRYCYKPLMWVDESLTDISYMYIPPEEEKY